MSISTARPSGQRRVAVDTGALLALASSRDQYHAKARQTADRLHADGVRLMGHALVLGELHGHLLHRVGAAAARRLVSGVLEDPSCEWLAVGPDLLRRAIARWIERYADQRFSLTDAVSFELMREARVTHAFAFDRDFVTAGFVLL